MKKNQRVYLKQKIDLYFDENFPATIIDELKKDRYWTRRCRIYTVYDFGNQNKEDQLQFEFCKKNMYTLVTLDNDFMNDKNYPFGSIPGIIMIIAKGNDAAKIKKYLNIFIDFVLQFPVPKYFLGDSKFQISETGCVMRARNYETGEIKTCTIVSEKTRLGEIAEKFSYPIF